VRGAIDMARQRWNIVEIEIGRDSPAHVRSSWLTCCIDPVQVTPLLQGTFPEREEE